MTIQRAARGKGNSGTFRIGFNNGDETEVDVKNRTELYEIWRDLSKEFGVSQNCVDYVEKV